jgi:hypothetical protein
VLPAKLRFSQWLPFAALRLSRGLVVTIAAATAAFGGFALIGTEASLVTAPLVQDDPKEPEPPARVMTLQVDAPVAPHNSTLVPHIWEDIGTGEPDLSFLDEDRPLTEEEVKLVASVVGWPENVLDEVAEVAWCESRYDPRAVNGPAIRGLMQVHVLWFDYSGTPLEQWDDPVVNLRVALAAYHYDLRRGYEPWTQWQCRPGGRYVPIEEFAPERPEAQAAATETAGDITDQPPAEATPTATPAPWEQRPAWPPPVDTPQAEATPVPASPEPEDSEKPQSTSVVVANPDGTYTVGPGQTSPAEPDPESTREAAD